MSSNINNFNSKVNLTKVLEGLGWQGLRIEKLNPFGEFICSSNNTYVANIFDLFRSSDNTPKPANEVYKEAIFDTPHLLKEPQVYSDYKARKMLEEDALQKQWLRIVEDSQQELLEHKYAIEDGPKITLADYFIKRGYIGVILNKFGHISVDVVNKYSNMDWDILKEFSKPVIIPYFHTPKHLSYIEAFDAKDENRRKVIYRSNFSGWAGSLGTVLNDTKSLYLKKGSTWNYTQDPWNTEIVSLDYGCSVELCLELFKTAKKTIFNPAPLDLILEKGMQTSVYSHVKMFNKDEILYLEDYLKLDGLFAHWKKIQEHEYTTSDRTYYKRYNGYFFIHRGTEYQLTNFVLTLRDRTKKDDRSYYIVEAQQNDKSILLEIPSHYFDSISKLKYILRENFLDLGFDMPKFYHPDAEKRLLNFIFDYFG